MTSTPSIPKSKKSFSGLDDLIAEAVSKKDTYHQMFNEDEQKKMSSEAVVPSSETSKNKSSGATPEVTPAEGNDLMRLQVKLPRDVFLASKIAALHQSISASKMVELALRQYLNLPPNS